MRLIRAAWPFAMLVLFALAFRGSQTSALNDSRSTLSTECVMTDAADVQRLELCLALQPGDVELMLDLGRVYESANRWADAERLYLRAHRVDPQDGDVHLRLATVLT